jgi:Uri superfamily endonuclease
VTNRFDVPGLAKPGPKTFVNTDWKERGSEKICVPSNPCLQEFPLSQENTHAMPATPGSYLLLFHLPTAVDGVQIGKLGLFSLAPGGWIYCGSAWGSGGLRSRVRRHLQADKKLHWHIDFLTNRLSTPAVLMAPQPDRSARLECAWTQHLLSLPGFSAPILHFGSSDCRECPAHLVHTARVVTVEELRGTISNQ